MTLVKSHLTSLTVNLVEEYPLAFIKHIVGRKGVAELAVEEHLVGDTPATYVKYAVILKRKFTGTLVTYELKVLVNLETVYFGAYIGRRRFVNIGCGTCTAAKFVDMVNSLLLKTVVTLIRPSSYAASAQLQSTSP